MPRGGLGKLRFRPLEREAWPTEGLAQEKPGPGEAIHDQQFLQPHRPGEAYGLRKAYQPEEEYRPRETYRLGETYFD